MAEVKFFWDPEGVELDSLGTKEYVSLTDGDTPYIKVSIRMLSIDTPEVHYPGGNQKPSAHNEKLKQLSEWIKEGKAPIQDGLAKYIFPRLAAGDAGTRQEQQGEMAKTFFEQLIKEKLTRPNGRKRPLFLKTANQAFDQYGRLLAYVAPNYTAEEREQLSREERATFNYLMVKAGWAASFIIYPSLPSHPDLVMFQRAAKEAFDQDLGAWSDKLFITGYEFRMCYKLWDVTNKLVKGQKLSSSQRYGWIERFCADMTTRQIYYPQDYWKVAPYDRLFIWPQEVTEAVGRLNLEPGS